MNIDFFDNQINARGISIKTEWPIKFAVDDGSLIVILLDPDSYILDPEYKQNRRRGVLPIRNLVAYSYSGDLLWSADFPDEIDYYYRIDSVSPLVAYSFSSYRCEIDKINGKIIRSEFFK